MKTKLAICSLVILTTAFCLSCTKGIRDVAWPTTEWKTVTPRQGGMDASVLDEVDPYVKANLPEVSSVLVVRNGFIIFERYFTGGVDTARSLWNQTTSVLAAVLGTAIEQGAIKNVDQRMIDFFPEKATSRRDPRVGRITLRHFLTMTDGIAASGNLLEPFFSDETKCRPLESEPGSAFNYNIASPDIVSILMTRATGRMAADLAGEFLFGPMGIKEFTWPESVPIHTINPLLSLKPAKTKTIFCSGAAASIAAA